MTSWFDPARQVPLSAVMVALGLERHGSEAGPCPHCGATRRGSQDRRRPLRVYQSPSGAERWTCTACNTGGDNLTLAALALTGAPKLRGVAWEPVRSWFADRWPSVPGSRRPLPSAVPSRPSLAPAAPVAPTVPSPTYPPQDEVQALWQACTPAHEDLSTNHYFMARGLEPLHIDHQDLARALPVDTPCPPWASTSRGPWSRSHFRVLVPLFDAFGELRSMKARWMHTRWSPERERWIPATAPRDGRLKSLNPRHSPGQPNLSISGLVVADQIGRWLLREGPRASRTASPDPTAPTLRWNGELWLVEGEGDAWALSTLPGRVERHGDVCSTYAVIGYVSGSFGGPAGDALAARILAATQSNNAELTIWPHDDPPDPRTGRKAGDEYARRIANKLPGAVIAPAGELLRAITTSEPIHGN